MDVNEAVGHLRLDPGAADLVMDAYLEEDVVVAAERYRRSAEFEAILRIGGELVRGRVLDIGAGRAIGAHAFATSGAAAVVALDPDLGEVVGLGAVAHLGSETPVAAVGGVGERLPFRDDVFDVVSLRQVLHHASSVSALIGECRRVVRPLGRVIAVREHVVDDDHQLAEFLSNHPVHQLAGGEHAYRLEDYIAAFRASGLRLERVLGPWDTVINAFPAARSDEEVRVRPRVVLEQRLGALGRRLGTIPLVERTIRSMMNRRGAGRLYSFVATKE